jgi:hypothetical protein
MRICQKYPDPTRSSPEPWAKEILFGLCYGTYRVADQNRGSNAFLTPLSGMEKNPDPG